MNHRQRPRGRAAYMAQILRLGELDLMHPAEDGVSHVYVHHDSWCDLLAGKGPCTCYPDVEVRMPKDDDLLLPRPERGRT